MRLNRRLAPDVYLGVLRVTRSSDGRLALDGDGETIDYVVWMRRLPAERGLAALLETDGVRPEMLDQLAILLAKFHAAAPTGDAITMYATPAAIGATWTQTLGLAAPLVGTVIAPEVIEASGEVSNLEKLGVLGDFSNSNYTAINAGLTAAGGAGVAEMKNQNEVTVEIVSTTQDVQIALVALAST